MTHTPEQQRRPGPAGDGADRPTPSGAAAGAALVTGVVARWRWLDVSGLAAVVGAARLLGP